MQLRNDIGSLYPQPCLFLVTGLYIDQNKSTRSPQDTSSGQTLRVLPLHDQSCENERLCVWLSNLYLITLQEWPCQTTPTDKHRQSYNHYDYRNKMHYELTKKQIKELQWCYMCPKQAEYVLLYRTMSCLVREKYCLSCAKENIVKL